MNDLTDKLKLINNPAVKLVTYILLAMMIGLGGLWVLLGIFSPVLLVLYLLKVMG